MPKRHPKRKQQHSFIDIWKGVWKDTLAKPMQPFIDRGLEIRENVAPETEYLFGAAANVFYITALLDPNLLPPTLQSMTEFFKENVPGANLALINPMALASVITVDGARRVAFERLPLVRAYVRSSINDLAKRI